MVTPGFPTITGDGLHFTTDAGPSMTGMAGLGFQDMSGDLRG